ncbi:hypothetical protein [Aestuariivivens insulae]|uniref:hypothetical protein n=1 Tax=Aestuariivivens insulae TaxID=1621988 RepID=UPI001F596317|nr:hypothetical protein [Aestuariivivens insulae]
MKNLESYGVLEMKPKEMNEVSGGVLGLLAVAAIALLASSCAPGCAAAKAVYER